MTAKPSTFVPIEPWQSTDGDTWTRRYMAAQGGGGYVRQATVDAAKGFIMIHVYRRSARPRRRLLCSCAGFDSLADRLAVAPLDIVRRPWLIGQKTKGVAK